MIKVIAIYINESQYIDIHVSTGFFVHYGIDYVGYYAAVGRVDKGHFGTIYVPLMDVEHMASTVRHEAVHACFDYFLSRQDWITENQEEEFAKMQDIITDGFIKKIKE